MSTFKRGGYSATEGRIILDGIDVREFDIKEWRREVTVLFQDYNQYQLSAWENIWLGDISQAVNRPQIQQSAESAGAHEVIRNLSTGYDERLGNWFGGQELSIGQWQKIALTRAFQRNSQLMVLDEPTSSLDVMSEYEVFERFREMIAGRSAILISHRLSTIRMAHRIYVLDNHRVAESGTHEELLAQDGIYAKLFNTQSQYYR